MGKAIKVIKDFQEVDGSEINEHQYLALKYGDKVLVQWEGKEPEVRIFTGFGLRSPLMATHYMGPFNYPQILAPMVNPNAMSVRRDMPLHMTVFPGGESLARPR
jgi:hypothetical protein